MKTSHEPAGGTVKAVVLGATGFLGTHICTALGEIGAHVLPVSRTGGIQLDLIGPGGLRGLAELLTRERPDVVINAVGRAWGATDEQLLESNATFVERLVGTLLTTTRPPRLVHLGSVHEYGRGIPGVATAEEDATAPVGRYGESKLLGSRAVLAAAGTVLRVANVSGPGSPPGSLLRNVAEHLAGGSPEPLRYASLSVWRDFVDARDVADAVVAAALAPEVAGQVVNIGSGGAVQMRTLVDCMVALSGRPVPVLVDDEGADRPITDWQLLDIAKAGRLLGWKPARSHDESLLDLLKSM